MREQHYRRLGRAQQAIIIEPLTNARIASAADEQSTVTQDASRNVVKIRELAERTATDAEQTTSVSNSLKELSDRLETLVQQFRF